MRDTGHGVARETIHQDLQTLNENVNQWTHDQAKSQWMARVQRMYIDTNQQIMNLQTLIRKIMESSAEPPKALLDAIALISEPKDRKAAQQTLDKLLELAKAYKHGGKVAFQVQAMIECQKHLVEVMTGGPLYAKLQEYSKQHEALNVGK